MSPAKIFNDGEFHYSYGKEMDYPKLFAINETEREALCDKLLKDACMIGDLDLANFYTDEKDLIDHFTDICNGGYTTYFTYVFKENKELLKEFVRIIFRGITDLRRDDKNQYLKSICTSIEQENFTYTFTSFEETFSKILVL